VSSSPLARLTRRLARADEINRYLITGELEVLRTRLHIVVLLRAALILLGTIVFAGLAGGGVSPESDRLLSGIVLAALAYLLWRMMQWYYEELIVTDLRILGMSGVLSRKVAAMPLRKVTDLTYNQSVPGRFGGFGYFVIESAGQDQGLSRLGPVPHSDFFYRTVTAQTFADPKQARSWSD
jgi:hypothetical protein